jgi:hypothetical protein
VTTTELQRTAIAVITALVLVALVRLLRRD